MISASIYIWLRSVLLYIAAEKYSEETTEYNILEFIVPAEEPKE